jgi:hypothetical protein
MAENSEVGVMESTKGAISHYGRSWFTAQLPRQSRLSLHDPRKCQPCTQKYIGTTRCTSASIMLQRGGVTISHDYEIVEVA